MVTYDFFGSNPVTVHFQSTSQFDGVGYSDITPLSLEPGFVQLQPAAGGGLLDFHNRPLIVKSVRFSDSGGSCALSIVYPDGTEISVATLNSANNATNYSFYLPYSATLKAVSTGGSGNKNLFVTAIEANGVQIL